MATSFPDVQDAYFSWLMTPERLRDPRSKTAFADRFGVSRQTLHAWERSAEFKGRLDAERTRLGVNEYGNVVGELLRIVKDEAVADANKINASRLLFDVLDMKPGAKVEKPKMVELSDEERARVVAALQKGD